MPRSTGSPALGVFRSLSRDRVIPRFLLVKHADFFLSMAVRTKLTC
jgi:hypothetical protein